MPLPTPNTGESEQDFIGRCMGNDTMNADFPEQEQRSAVCHKQWRGDGKNALKAIRSDDETLTVANYIVLFGGRDLEGEYFTADTDLESGYTKTGRLYIDWEHGADDLGADDVLGHVDWSTAKADDRGVWVERVLQRRNQYVKWLEPLIADGLVGSSSEAVAPQVAKAEDGQITRWPLRRDTLTVTPMEPRMLTENYVQAFKALGIELPDAEQPEPEPEAAPEADQSAVAAAKVAADILLFSIKALQEE
jgi:hypothetical protein